MEEKKQKKSGIVTLIGRSNVGKSTLLNALVGFKVSAVSPKAQTTRWAAKGVYNDERGQIVFVDTPGLFLQVPNSLTKAVNQEVRDSIRGIDLLLYIVDPKREIGAEEKRLLSMIRSIDKKILVINKIDTPHPKYLAEYEDLVSDFDDAIKVSAKIGTHLKGLINLVFDRLKVGELLYDPNDSHDQNFNNWVAEVVREKVFHHVHQEVPYSVHVEVEEVNKRKDNTLYIKVKVFTNDERYKPMLIGAKGSKLKQIGTASRIELELILQQKIYLDLEVEVDKHWLERV